MNIAYAASNSPISVSVSTNAWEAILHASPVVQMVLIILALMSVVSWGIILTKFKKLSDLKNANEPFYHHFWKAKSLDDLYKEIAKYSESSIARLFKAGYIELQKIAESQIATGPSVTNEPPKLSGLDNLDRVMRKTVESEVAILEKRLSVLATTGSTGPVIGLFGTVWGIMNAFQKIGLTGSASLAVVAPGIAEALIATAIGLAAAIPAVIAYNYFISKIRKEEIVLNNFAADFLNIVKRNFFKDS